MEKTTAALVELDHYKIDYKIHEYPTVDGPVAAIDVANYMGFSIERLFKTLVTTDHHGGYYVFCLPAANRIDMKKAAEIVNVKNLTMLQPEKFEELTGYIHGGCSPFGLKTKLPIYVEKSALAWKTIYISGGQIGLTVEVNPQTIIDKLGAEVSYFIK